MDSKKTSKSNLDFLNTSLEYRYSGIPPLKTVGIPNKPLGDHAAKTPKGSPSGTGRRSRRP